MINYHALRNATETYLEDISEHSGDELITFKKVGDEALRMALFYPPAYAYVQKFPLIVLIHGGGWISKKKFADQAEWSGDYLGFFARRYSKKGYLCASVDYRLLSSKSSSENLHLADICSDCADAVAYLKDHAEELKIDLKRTIILGESAGGYLAAAMITLPWMDLSFFKNAILINPITDLSDARWGGNLSENNSHPALVGRSILEQQIILSPAMQINDQTCPTLLIHGDEDTIVLPFHSRKYHDMLQAKGQVVQMSFVHHTEHAFLLAEYMKEAGKSLDALNLAETIIDNWLTTCFSSNR